MDKMTPDSLRDAIHGLAGEANAPHTPPHLMQESPEDLQEGKTRVSPNTIRSIAQATQQNDHVGALIIVAESILKSKKLTDALKGLASLRDYYGHRTPALTTVYEDLYKKTLAIAKSNTRPEDYTLIHGAF